MRTMTYTGELTIRTCWCGIVHAIPSDLSWQINNKGTVGYCPLGHEYVNKGKTEAQSEREQRREVEAREQHLRDQLQASERAVQNAQRRVSAMKGVVTKTKQRAAKAMCPVPGCKRHFANVRRHVQTQHPDYEESLT